MSVLNQSIFLRTVLLVLVSVATDVHGAPPELPLANVYHQGTDLSEYWVSEKLDGVRAYWDGEHLWSRGGHQYQSPEWFTKRFPDDPLDGELWLGRGRFSELSGIVRTQVPVDQDWRRVSFHVFDLPMQNTPFSERYEELRAIVADSGSPYLALVRQHPISSHRALMEQLDQTVAAGGEGLMLKRKESLYLGGRSDDLLKVKPFQDREAVVVEQIPGRGKYEGMMGALLVELPSGRRFRIGTGFSDAERQSPPEPGQTVTFKFHGYTSTGLPRFASYLRIRNDEPR